MRFLRLMFGLFLYALGIVLTIRANVGYGPWEVFHAGLGKTLGMSIGNASILVGLAIIGITLAMGERIGVGTILNMVVIGIFIDLLLGSGIIPLVGNLWAGIAVLLLGLYSISIGSFFYIGSGFGAGPRDGLMVVLTRRLGLPVGLIRSAIELSATLCGWLLGGMVGIGTLISGLAIGFCIQTTFGLLKFDPTNIAQQTIRESAAELRMLSGAGRNRG